MNLNVSERWQFHQSRCELAVVCFEKKKKKKKKKKKYNLMYYNLTWRLLCPDCPAFSVVVVVYQCTTFLRWTN